MADTVTPPPADDTSTAAERMAARKQLEREKIARSLRQAEAGQLTSGDALDRWLDLYESSESPDPIPIPPRQPTKQVD